MATLVSQASFDLLIGLVVERANLHANRAAVVFVEIGETILIAEIGFMAVGVNGGIIVKGICRAVIGYPIADFSTITDSCSFPALCCRL